MKRDKGYFNDGWTLPFSVDQLDDFQTQLDIPEHKESLIQNLDIGQKWNDPSNYTNGKKIVRVVITPNEKDLDSTLLIIFEEPEVEEFIIKNKSPLPLEIFKYHKT